MTKNIILLSDGTGNAASRVWRTNVWRLFQALDLSTPNQVACYDDGVGTSSFKPLAVLGGAFGWGLKRNVLDLYTFLCRNYSPGDQIFGFGFSRGAFTMRVVMGLIAHQGLIKTNPDADLDRLARAAYRRYREERFHTLIRIEWIFRKVRNGILWLKDTAFRNSIYDPKRNIVINEIHFLGLWDTVAAYGLPVDEMTRGVSLVLWPLELPDHQLSKKVRRACHALALDDERTTFHPVLWTEEGETDLGRLKQVWFSGVHSNVGGGYPDDSLAHIPLYWIVEEARASGLAFKNALNVQPDPESVAHIKVDQDKDGRLYDSRAGVGGYYRYGPRKILDLCNAFVTKRQSVKIPVPKIHESAFARILQGAHVYAPIGIPENYAVMKRDGSVVQGQNNPYEQPSEALFRATIQEKVWDLVWWRRVVYFLTVGASLHLALFPLFHQTDRAAEFETPLRIVSEGIRLVGGFVPRFFVWWLDSFATNPGTFLFSAGLVALLIWIGVWLGSRITGKMCSLWCNPQLHQHESLGGFPYAMRTSVPYVWTLWALKRWVIPIISACGIVYVLGSVGNHLLFHIADGAGYYCKETENPVEVQWLGKIDLDRPFNTKDMCWATGVKLNENYRYLVTIKQNGAWKDGSIDADIGGFEISELKTWDKRVAMFLGVPLRRVFLRDWFWMIGRIGAIGTDEYFLDQDKPTSVNKPKPDEVSSAFTTRRDGELFLYVNDAVLFPRSISNAFYANNDGTARVTIQHLPRR